MSKTLSIPTIKPSETHVSLYHNSPTVQTLTVVAEMRNTSDSRRPSRHPQKRQDHLGHDTAMHTHEDRPFRVLVHVAGTVLFRFIEASALYFVPGPVKLIRTKYRSNSLESRLFRWNCASRESARCSMKVGRGVSRSMGSFSFDGWAVDSARWLTCPRASTGTGAAVVSPMPAAGASAVGECPSLMVERRVRKGAGKQQTNAWV